ncbi:MAG: GNAT family protein [Planctomycetota bacterium]
MAVKHVALEGSLVTLEPMAIEHAPELLGAASTEETFWYFSRPPQPFDESGMYRYCAALIDDPTNLPHVVRDRSTRRIIGATSYCSIRVENRGVEIGWTWYDPEYRGTGVNPECKRLLLRRAFETDLFDTGPAIRVELKTDARNERSRAAILKLGAKFEGVLRRHVIMSDGYLRDSAIYSIVPEEWPEIDAELGRRIDAAPYAKREPWRSEPRA